mgnify:CR=1 FL=1
MTKENIKQLINTNIKLLREIKTLKENSTKDIDYIHKLTIAKGRIESELITVKAREDNRIRQANYNNWARESKNGDWMDFTKTLNKLN